jgi:hypothetical protein
MFSNPNNYIVLFWMGVPVNSRILGHGSIFNVNAILDFELLIRCA